jgi:hypothetical protein
MFLCTYEVKPGGTPSMAAYGEIAAIDGNLTKAGKRFSSSKGGHFSVSQICIMIHICLSKRHLQG